jgi:hypothetical protein
MRITSRDGTRVTLQPQGYEFPPDTWNDEWDRWLMIGGHVQLDDRAWSFTDPCLLIIEAQQLGNWLRGAAAGDIRPQPLHQPGDQDQEPSLGFTEPLLTFFLGVHDPDLVVRVRFALEAAPPWLDRDDRFPPGGFDVDLQVDPVQLHQAADDWTSELDTLLSRLRPGSATP